jgi:hypothetical protein
MEYYAFSPFGNDREDWRMGTIAAQIVNMANGKNKLTPADFALPKPKSQKQKEADLKKVLRKFRSDE